MKNYAQNLLDGFSKKFKKNLCIEHDEQMLFICMNDQCLNKLEIICEVCQLSKNHQGTNFATIRLFLFNIIEQIYSDKEQQKLNR